MRNLLRPPRAEETGGGKTLLRPQKGGGEGDLKVRNPSSARRWWAEEKTRG